MLDRPKPLPSRVSIPVKSACDACCRTRAVEAAESSDSIAESEMANRHDRIRDIFLAALEMPAEERAAYLDKTCGTDFELRADVERLIENDGPTDSFSHYSQLTQVANSRFTVGAMVGARFRIDQFISAGGMGEVYQALDTRLGRMVAIKVARGNFTRRFEQEARAIAALNHPNISTLIRCRPKLSGHGVPGGKTAKGPPSTSEGDRVQRANL
jgi:hypothetical protein